MKGIFVFILSLFIIQASAQGINFQGVARGANGVIIAGSKISLRLSILAKSANGTPEYVEARTVNTNAQGIFSVVLGDSSIYATVGSFSNVTWKEGQKYLKVEMDPSGGTSYLSMGTTQLQNVPFSFYSLGVDATNVSGILPIAKGGTGVATLAELKTGLSLDKVNNTADADKPISTATQTALDTKLAKADTLSLSNRINAKISASDNVNFTKDITVNGLTIGVGSGNASSTSNTAIGKIALSKNTSGSDNVAIGNSALSSNTTGAGNISVGSTSMLSNTTGSMNVTMGTAALWSNTTGIGNTAIGQGSLLSNSTGNYNVAVGFQPLWYNNLGSNNVAIGQSALMTNVNNSGIVAIGFQSMSNADSRSNGTNTGNTAVGYQSLKGSTTPASNTGQYNTALGYQTLTANTSGEKNTALGYSNLTANTTGSDNLAIGFNALLKNTTGGVNIAIGSGALQESTTASSNVAIGAGALASMTSPGVTYNSAIGEGSLLRLTTGVNNDAQGVYSLSKVTTGSNNIAMGRDAGQSITTGSNNVFLGRYADATVPSVSNSVALGNGASVSTSNTIQLGDANITDVKTAGAVTATGYKIPGGTSAQYLRADGTVTTSVTAGVPYTGASQAVDLGAYDLTVNGMTVGFGNKGTLSNTVVKNTVFGNKALYSNSNGNYNTAIGYNVLYNNTTGSTNTATGYLSLYSNTTGSYNDAYGFYSLRLNTTGSYNAAYSRYTLYRNTTGNYNSAFGNRSLYSNTIGNENSAFGKNALTGNVSGEKNTAIGADALSSNSTGNYNTAVGDSALTSNVANTSSVAVGFKALAFSNNNNVVQVAGNTAVGSEALRGSEIASNNTGAYNTSVGYKAISNITTGSYNTALGYNTMINNTAFNNSTAIGANAEVTGSNQIKLGDDNITNVTTAGIVSSGKGFLAQGLTAAQRDAIDNPSAGLIIYCSNCGTNGEIQFYNGVAWKNINGTSVSTPTQNSISLKSSVGTDKQFVTVNTSITSIVYATSLATGVTITNLPTGITGVWSNNSLTISGTPTTQGNFNYTITLTGGSGTITKTGSITVGSLNITLSSATGTDSQTICNSYSPITNITYTTSGATNVTFVGLPGGISGTYSGTSVTISGTPSAPGNYNYSVIASDGTNSKTIKGTLSIVPMNSATLVSGSESQNIVLTNPLTPIIYSTSGATNVTVTGLITGTSAVWANNTLTISGTPTTVGLSGYVINLQGGCGVSYNPNNVIQVHRVCAYTSMAGSYKVVKDEWGDWNTGDIVTITDGPTANTLNLSAVYPNAAYATKVNSLIININPTTGEASISSPIIFGNYGSSYTATANSVSGNVYACDGQISLAVNIGTYGTFNLILQKQ